jgi:hypothetical protein
MRISAYDLSDVTTVVDLGGGLGNLLEALLKANPSLKGTPFELRTSHAQPSKGCGPLA